MDVSYSYTWKSLFNGKTEVKFFIGRRILSFKCLNYGHAMQKIEAVKKVLDSQNNTQVFC